MDACRPRNTDVLQIQNGVAEIELHGVKNSSEIRCPILHTLLRQKFANNATTVEISSSLQPKDNLRRSGNNVSVSCKRPMRRFSHGDRDLKSVLFERCLTTLSFSLTVDGEKQRISSVLLPLSIDFSVNSEDMNRDITECLLDEVRRGQPLGWEKEHEEREVMWDKGDGYCFIYQKRERITENSRKLPQSFNNAPYITYRCSHNKSR